MIQIVLRLLLAAVVGSLIGLSMNNAHTARVFSLVCTGAALITITSIQFFQAALFPWYSDPGRLSAQIISALGFIGTGLIWIREDKEIMGLSSAAALWLTAILGMLIGAGLRNPTVAALFFTIVLYYSSTLIISWKKKE